MSHPAPALAFGTDGVRGLANRELSTEYVLALGQAAAVVLGGGSWIIGRDTRRSGSMLQAALAAGLASRGAEVRDIGVLPTPGVAYHSEIAGCPAAMISASHNPFGDNGIKFFAAGGTKLDDATQHAIEAELASRLARGRAEVDPSAPTGAAVGEVGVLEGAHESYGDHLVRDVIAGRRLDGMTVVIDAANGAASAIAPIVLQRLGATVTVLHANPDGVNINAGCGSTHPEDLAHAVVARRAQAGLAFDGDADRLVAVDETGQVVDGDALLGMFAIDRAARDLLPDRTIVATVMSNLGLHRALAAHDITVAECAVGDRHVLATLEANGWTLGGEQSGHLVFRDLATTGDGILAGIQLLDLLVRSETPLSALASVVERLPQVLENVRLEARPDGLLDAIEPDVARARAELGDAGRVLVRLSGTEPLVRVMVEAERAEVARSVTNDLVAAVRRAAPGAT